MQTEAQSSSEPQGTEAVDIDTEKSSDGDFFSTLKQRMFGHVYEKDENVGGKWHSTSDNNVSQRTTDGLVTPEESKESGKEQTNHSVDSSVNRDGATAIENSVHRNKGEVNSQKTSSSSGDPANFDKAKTKSSVSGNENGKIDRTSDSVVDKKNNTSHKSEADPADGLIKNAVQDSSEDGCENITADKSYDSNLYDQNLRNGSDGKPDSVKDLSKPVVAKDNLTKIKGIGPVINAQLLKLGYVSYEQIAELDDERIKTLRGQLKHEQDIHNQDWMGQARKLIKQRDSLK